MSAETQSLKEWAVHELPLSERSRHLLQLIERHDRMKATLETILGMGSFDGSGQYFSIRRLAEQAMHPITAHDRVKQDYVLDQHESKK